MKLHMVPLVFVLGIGSAQAIEHPACAGKDNSLCDTFGMLINVKGKGCYRLMTVEPQGKDTYRLTCELASYDRSLVVYTLQFTDGRRSYTLD